MRAGSARVDRAPRGPRRANTSPRGRAGVFGLAAVLAVAAGGQDAGAQPLERVRARVQLPAWRSSIVLDTLALRNRVTLEAPPARVWPALVRAVRSLDAELAQVTDSAAGLVGTLGLVANRQLAGASMARWLDCGIGMAGPYANTHRITLAFAALLDPLPGDRTQLGLALAASGIERGGTTSVAVQCNTLGALEAEVVARTRATLR